MRIFRARFTVRRLMVAVAILGLLLGLCRWLVVMRTRSAAYQKIAFQFAQYPSHARIGHNWHVTTSDGRVINYHEDENFWIQHAWGTRLANKYWKLSLRPWLAAGPDPPRPEPLARPRAAVDCPAELTLSGSYRCDWCAPNSWALDAVYPWWTIPWTWPPERFDLIPRYSFS